MIKTFRDLMVWRKSMALVTQVYEATKSFSKDELYGITSQIRRCAVSIPSNIAEGYGRKSTKDYVRFLEIALGSLYELQTQLEISVNLKYITELKFQQINDNSREIERMLSSLIKKVEGSL